MVTRQPEVSALDAENPYPADDAEVAAWLESAGFDRTDNHWQNWVRKADGLELEDVHPGNFIKTKDGLRPIDVQLR